MRVTLRLYEHSRAGAGRARGRRRARDSAGTTRDEATTELFLLLETFVYILYYTERTAVSLLYVDQLCQLWVVYRWSVVTPCPHTRLFRGGVLSRNVIGNVASSDKRDNGNINRRGRKRPKEPATHVTDSRRWQTPSCTRFSSALRRPPCTSTRGRRAHRRCARPTVLADGTPSTPPC